MSSPSALPSFAGGVGLALSAHTLLSLNGSVLGISGFVHRAARGSKEAVAGVLAFVLAGCAIGRLEGPLLLSGTSFATLAVSGLLVGIGTKLANGCTSGHMLCGISRLSSRSIAATLAFFTTASITSKLVHNSLPAVSGPFQSVLSRTDGLFLGSAAVLLSTAWLSRRSETESSGQRRMFVQVLSSMAFGFSLHVSKLFDPSRVIGFLALPRSPAFDPSLLFLAIGAMPLLSALYHLGSRRIKSNGGIDTKMLVGAAIFGIGWGIEGICPGPALVNFGQSLASGDGQGALRMATWLAALVGGGLVIA